MSVIYLKQQKKTSMCIYVWEGGCIYDKINFLKYAIFIGEKCSLSERERI